MNEVALPLHGGCVCGGVRFALNATPLLVYACHCHDCQKRSGAAFALTVVVRTADVAIAGDVEILAMTSPSSRAVDHGLCPHCRFRIFARAPVAPDYMSVRAGTFDDTGWMVPIAQTWVESAIPWAIMPGVRQVSPAEFDFFSLGKDWRATAPRFVAGRR